MIMGSVTHRICPQEVWLFFIVSKIPTLYIHRSEHMRIYFGFIFLFKYFRRFSELFSTELVIHFWVKVLLIASHYCLPSSGQRTNPAVKKHQAKNCQAAKSLYRVVCCIRFVFLSVIGSNTITAFDNKPLWLFTNS